MKKTTISLIAALSALTFAIPASAGGPAFPRVAPPATADTIMTVDIIDVKYRKGRRDSHRLERRGGHTYLRGHRGSRHARPGYRRQGDYWFPPAAFALGAILGGAIASQPPARAGMPDPHMQWCYNSYRSYRPSDNSFQPFNGPRRQCRSPYM